MTCRIDPASPAVKGSGSSTRVSLGWHCSTESKTETWWSGKQVSDGKKDAFSWEYTSTWQHRIMATTDKVFAMPN